MNLRDLFYKSARTMGDANAVARGSDAIKKRIARRVVGRGFSRIMRHLIP